MNPYRSYLELVRKDPVKNIDVHRNYACLSADFTESKNKWAIGTTKHTYNKVNNEGSLDRTKYTPQTFPRNPTNIISFDPPANERPF